MQQASMASLLVVVGDDRLAGGEAAMSVMSAVFVKVWGFGCVGSSSSCTCGDQAGGLGSIDSKQET